MEARLFSHSPAAVAIADPPLSGQYVYLNRSGELCSEVTGQTSWFGRFIYSLLGLRNYKLEAVLKRALQRASGTWSIGSIEGQTLAKKTFRTMQFNHAESEDLTTLLSGRSLRVRSDDDIMAFNRRLSEQMPKLASIFNLVARKKALQDLRTVTFKAGSFRALQEAPSQAGGTFAERCEASKESGKLGAADCYQLDKLHSFNRDFLQKDTSQVLLAEDDPVRTLAARAEEARASLLQRYSTAIADVVLYDSPTIESAKMWSYSPVEKLYFFFKRSWLGHAAIQYRTQDGESRLSHMMEEHEDTAVGLQHLIFQRYRLDLQRLLTDEAKAALLATGVSEDELEAVLRKEFDQLSAEHIAENQSFLQKSTNSLANQLFFPFSSTLFKKSLDQTQARPYKSVMLCSEYAQLSLVNRIVAFGNRLQERYGLQQPGTRVPLGSRDFDLASPGDFLERWKEVLVETPSLLSSND